MELITSSSKVEKGEAAGYLTGIMYLSPSNISGVNICPFATEGCISVCLYESGRSAIFKVGEKTNAILDARLARTRLMLDNKTGFFAKLHAEIPAHVRKAKRKGLTPCIRLNGTSDLDWTSSVIARHPDVQFYDYSKSRTRAMRYAAGVLPANYHVTYSRTENDTPMSLQHMLDAGVNVAVPYTGDVTRLAAALQVQAETIDGDATDLRFLDPKGGRGVLVALTAKGRAKKDTSGFVVHLPK